MKDMVSSSRNCLPCGKSDDDWQEVAAAKVPFLFARVSLGSTALASSDTHEMIVITSRARHYAGQRPLVLQEMLGLEPDVWLQVKHCQ